jgi:biopolymer transport protein ExbD
MFKKKEKKAGHGGGGVFADINITPLTDIFLVLLIIFMVTTAVTIESAAHVDLPKAEASQPTDKPKGIIVTYTADHQIMVGSQQVTEAQLMTTLQQQLAPLQSSDKIVIFQGDPKVILGDMVRILDIAKTAGAEAIAIAVSQLPAGGSGAAPGGGA